MSPSIRDLKGRVIEPDAAPVQRRPVPVEPPAVLTPEALAAKRRLEERERPHGPSGWPPLPDPDRGTAMITVEEIPLPADLAAALREIETAVAACVDSLSGLATRLQAVREAVAGLRGRATTDALALAKLEAIRKALGGT
jgi:hypothetical protein